MRRSFIILIGVLAVGVTIFGGSYFLAQWLCARHMSNPADDLAWLRQEFRLNDSEMAQVRKLHDGYLPKCSEMCAKIAAKKREVDQALAGATNVTAAIERQVMELCELRAQCQLQMLRHFAEVSQVMPPQQGRRYLAEMQRLTLGYHEQIEQSMSGSAGQAHGHH
jgi:hypothetical protein